MTTSKTFLRDGTEVPSYAVLFFGGKVDVDHLGRGLKVGDDGWLKFRAWARIGVLVNQLKRLLSAELDCKIQDPNQDGKMKCRCGERNRWMLTIGLNSVLEWGGECYGGFNLE
jgi:hypothetical protein